MGLKVVVSGGGIAGLALAYWLDRIGATTIVVERAPCFQALGHYISLKGNGVEMVRRMGILDACQARAAPIDEIRMYSKRGRLLRADHTTAMTKMLGGYILFRRADLQAALYDLARERVDIRFGLQVSDAHIADSGVEVQLSDGRVEQCDVLVGADGIHSKVRGLVFGDGFERPFGGHYIAVTQALRHGLPPVGHAYWGAGQMVSLFPVAEDSISTIVYTDDRALRPPHHDARAMREYLLSVSEGFPPHVREILGNLSSNDFVFSDVIAQIEMPHISKGRCVLLGDAAHCPTFMSGMGSSLALQDAHVLAGCLGRHQDDVTAALQCYEHVMTPIALRYHDSALSMRGLILHCSPLKAKLRDMALSLTPDRVYEAGVRRFIAAEQPLPDVSSTSKTES